MEKLSLSSLIPLFDQAIKSKSVKDLAQNLVSILKQNLSFDCTGFYFINPETQKVELVWAEGLNEEERKISEATAMNRHPGYVIKTKKPYLSNNDTIENMVIQREEIFKSRMYCPLIYQDHCIGAIGVVSTNANQYTQAHLEFLQFAATFTTATYEKINFERQNEISSERLSLAKEALTFGVWDWNLKTNNLIWDDYMYQIFDIDPHKFNFAYEAFENCLHPEDRVRLTEEMQAAFLRKDKIFKSEFRIITAKNETRIIAASGKCIYDQDGSILRLVGANWDVTSTRNTEAQLIHASKMSSLGEMASGIAHEINNPLAVIESLTNSLQRYTHSANFDINGFNEKLEKISNSVHRIASIVKGLKTYSHGGGSKEIMPSKIKELILSTLDLAHARLEQENIKLLLSLPREEIILKCNPTQISQVLINLINNAADAIELQSSKWISISLKSDNNKIYLTITDSGNGIPEKIRSKLFEPFFTTKPIGKGTGLGLSISYGLIRNHNGNLYVEAQNPNTTFVIELPRFSQN